MNINDFNNKIVILSDSSKKSFLKCVEKSNILINVKIITLNELKRKYFFDYSKETILYLMKKYNINQDIARMYIDNMYYVDNKINIDKVDNLIDIKNDLDNQGLIIKNELFKEFLKNKDIIIYNSEYSDKFYLNLFAELEKISNVSYINDNYTITVKNIYKASTKEDEISFVASSICDLVKHGADINNIKLANVNDNYYYTIKKIFKLYNIPIELDKNQTIKGTKIVKMFKDLFSTDVDNTMSELKKHVNTSNDSYIYKKIIDVINLYDFTDNLNEVKSSIFYDIDHIKCKNIELKNSVKVIDIMNDLITDNYVYLINFNEGIIPNNIKDEDYFSDIIKNKLNISDSSDLNYKAILNIKSKISQYNNLVVSYCEFENGIEQYISSAYDESLFNKKIITQSYNHSNKYNKLKLVSLKDEYRKYNNINEELLLLNSAYSNENYLSYDNKYKQINKEKLFNFIGNKLTLSYSSINSYYECKYKYYLNSILKLNKFEDTFEITIGNIFHKILSQCFVDNFDFDNAWNIVISECKYQYNNMESFFLNNLKDELLLIIETIKNQLKYTLLDKSMYEKEIKISINDDLHITFKGYVDKILYKEKDNQTIVAIIDYKTGNPNLSINNVQYGLEMQLPVYIYLIKNMKEISNVKIGGFYLQKILNNTIDKNKRIDDLKLQGYSNSDINILKEVDSSYENSDIIKSLKMSSNGFYSYSKVISDEEIDNLSSIVADKVKEASNEILNASFDINPKEIDNKLISCKYCKYKDICYMKNDDIIKIKSNSSGGDEDASMD